MSKFTALFEGRRVGAIGITYVIRTQVEAADPDAAHLKLYDHYDHISGLQLRDKETRTVWYPSMNRTWTDDPKRAIGKQLPEFAHLTAEHEALGWSVWCLDDGPARVFIRATRRVFPTKGEAEAYAATVAVGREAEVRPHHVGREENNQAAATPERIEQ